MAARNTPSAGCKPNKLWRDAISVAVNREGDDNTKRKMLAVLADKLVTAALNGDIAALKEIGDRLDGKASQDISANLSGNVTVNGTIKYVRPGNNV